ncbi:MAG TPA: hypothetical protein VFZ48_02295 [Candidatus Saccharimonadales bacterium]
MKSLLEKIAAHTKFAVLRYEISRFHRLYSKEDRSSWVELDSHDHGIVEIRLQSLDGFAVPIAKALIGPILTGPPGEADQLVVDLLARTEDEKDELMEYDFFAKLHGLLGGRHRLRLYRDGHSELMNRRG